MPKKYFQDPDPEAVELAHRLLTDPAAIPHVLELPKPEAVQILTALAAVIVDMHARLTVLKALHQVDSSGGVASQLAPAGQEEQKPAGQKHTSTAPPRRATHRRWTG